MNNNKDDELKTKNIILNSIGSGIGGAGGGGGDNNNNEAVKCIFLCEFHVTAGRKIVVQVPDNYLSKDKFETVSQYVIPQVQLQRSFLSVSLLGIKILGYPVRIGHKQYARNAFYFNICFVFAPTTRTIGYEPIVKKLSEYLLAMETSNRILSQQQNAVQLSRLARLMTQVRNDINSKKVCMLQEGSTLIPLCVVPRYKETVKVYPHQAVALTDEFYKYVQNQWDLTTLRILPYIDGFNHINRITALADVALELVCDCIKHLVILGVAVLVPVFQYSNVYRPTPKISQLAKCKELQQKCVQKCSKPGRQNANVRDIFRIFASMAHGATFGELCVRFNPAALNINEKQMVLFGQLEGLIRRVDRYPVRVNRDLFAGAEDDIVKPKVSATVTTSTVTTMFETATATTITATNSENNNNNNYEFKPRIYMRLPSKPLPRKNQNSRSTTTGYNHHHHHHPHHHNTRTNLSNTKKWSESESDIIDENDNDDEDDEDDDDDDDDDDTYNTTEEYTNQTENENLLYKNKKLSYKLSKNFYNGFKSFDEICCATGMSCQQLDAYLARDKHVIVLLK